MLIAHNRDNAIAERKMGKEREMYKGIKTKDIKEFEKHAKALDALIRQIREYCPEASLYAGCSILYLLNGASHYEDGHHGGIVADEFVKTLSGGDW